MSQQARRGYRPTRKAPDVGTWLTSAFDPGRGHAMAFFGVLESATLRLDAKANR